LRRGEFHKGSPGQGTDQKDEVHYGYQSTIKGDAGEKEGADLSRVVIDGFLAARGVNQ